MEKTFRALRSISDDKPANYVLILLTILLASFLAGCASPVEATPPSVPLTAITLKLSWKPGVDFIGYYAAVSKGYYQEEGLEVDLQPLDDIAEYANYPQAAAEGENVFALGAHDIQAAQSNGIQITAIANLYKLTPGAFFTRAESGIQSPADLAGHTIVVKNDAWGELLELLLASGGLTAEDVKIVPGGFDMTPFLEGEVDVWSGFLTDEVVRARQAGLDLITFPMHEYGHRSPTGTIYTSSKLIDTDPDMAVRFLRASLRGWDWAIDNPAAAVDLFIELFPEKIGEREFLLSSFSTSVPLILPSGANLGEIDCESWIVHEAPASLSSTDGFCSTKIFQAASE